MTEIGINIKHNKDFQNATQAIERLTKIVVSLTERTEDLELKLEMHEYEHHGVISDRMYSKSGDFNAPDTNTYDTRKPKYIQEISK